MSCKKLAIFVEGQTEAIFTKKLLEEVAGKKNIILSVVNASNLAIFQGYPKSGNAIKYFVLVVDCGNDESVKSRILDNRESLIRSGYSLILGLRDLYPRPRQDLPRVEMALRTGVPTKGIDIEICLAVMETEAWFVQECKHYIKIDPSLSAEAISNATGFNPETDDAELLNHPADTLKAIYRLAKKTYKKKRWHVERTVNALDYDNLYSVVRMRMPRLGHFLDCIDNFL